MSALFWIVCVLSFFRISVGWPIPAIEGKVLLIGFYPEMLKHTAKVRDAEYVRSPMSYWDASLEIRRMEEETSGEAPEMSPPTDL